jgi:hypothetical protein
VEDRVGRPPAGLPDSDPDAPWVGAHALRGPSPRPAGPGDARRARTRRSRIDARTGSAPAPSTIGPAADETTPDGTEPTTSTTQSDVAARPNGADPGARGAPVATGKRLDAVLVLVLALVAAATARHVLGPAALSAADANRALVAKASSIGELGAAAFADLGHGPLLALVLRLSGGSIVAGQMPAFAAALFAPGVVYAAARRLALHRAGAFVAGAVVACSNLQAFHAGTLRTGTIVTLISALLLFQGAGVLAAEDRDELRRRMVFLGATTVVGGLTALLVLPAAVAVWAVVLAGSARRFGVRTLARPVMVGVDIVAIYALFVLPANAGASLRDDSPTGGHLVDDRGTVELLRSVGGAYQRVLSGLRPDVGAGPAHVVDVVLGAALVVGIGVLAVRRRRGTWLLVAPPLVATALALAHVVPLGGRADTWLLPSLAVCVAVALEPVVRRLPVALGAVAAVALISVAAVGWDTARPADAMPSLGPLVDALAAVPATECVVIDGIAPASFHWATTWDVRLVGRVPGQAWVKVGYPGRCVSFPGSGPEWFDRGVGTTTDPGSDVAWWVRPAGADSAEPPETFTVVDRRPVGGYELLRLRRR